MKKLLLALSTAIISIVFTGCLSSGIDISVNKDGSGEIIETFYVLKEYVAFMGLDEENSDPNMINREQLNQKAKTMGEGVTFSKVEAAEGSSPLAGYKAYYTFSDITKIKTSITPMTAPGELVEEDTDWITFNFKKGSSPVLTINSKQQDESETSEDMETYPESEETDEGMIEQMKEIYESMNFWFKITVNGRISDTNASYSEGSTVTIMDMNFEKIVENDELFTKITSDTNSELKDYKEELEKIGVKIDDQEKIEIKFR